MCTEERWYNCFARQIQPHQKLDSLQITLSHWRDPDHANYVENWMMQKPDDAATLAKWRNSLINMWEYYITGIKRVRIVNREDDGFGLDRTDRDAIAARMMRSKSLERKRPVKRRVSLEEMLRRAPALRERERIHLTKIMAYF